MKFQAWKIEIGRVHVAFHVTHGYHCVLFNDLLSELNTRVRDLIAPGCRSARFFMSVFRGSRARILKISFSCGVITPIHLPVS